VVEFFNGIKYHECKVVHPADNVTLELLIPIPPTDSPRSIRQSTNPVFEVLQAFRTPDQMSPLELIAKEAKLAHRDYLAFLLIDR
jgi:hypothetical protein